MDEGGVGIGEFIVPRGDAPELLAVVDEPFDLVAVAVGERAEVGRRRLGRGEITATVPVSAIWARRASES